MSKFKDNLIQKINDKNSIIGVIDSRGVYSNYTSENIIKT